MHSHTQGTFDVGPTFGNQDLEAALAFHGSERQIDLRWFRIYDEKGPAKSSLAWQPLVMERFTFKMLQA